MQTDPDVSLTMLFWGFKLNLGYPPRLLFWRDRLTMVKFDFNEVMRDSNPRLLKLM